MKQTVARQLLPAIVVALGILASTQIAALMPGSAWPSSPTLQAMVGPLILAVAIGMASLLSGRHPERTRWIVACILGGIVLAASAIIVIKDPAGVTTLLPILGAGVGFSALLPARRQDASRCAS